MRQPIPSNHLSLFGLLVVFLLTVSYVHGLHNGYSENHDASGTNNFLKESYLYSGNQLKVKLKGSIAGGVYAHFAVYVNDKKVGEQFSSASYQSYKFSLDIAPEKVEKVQVVFDNDAVINGQDRNLYVESITIEGKVTNATTQNVVYKNKSGTVIPYHGIMAWSGELIFSFKQTSKPKPYTYTSINKEKYDLFLWEGKNVVFLTKSDKLDPDVVNHLLSVIDQGYDYYFNATGRKPTPHFHYNGKITIAQVDNTCGAGCGFLGATGIELLDQYFDLFYNTYVNQGKYDHIVFYELGRNFWFYADRIEYKPPAATGNITTGYAVFMRDMIYESLGISAADFNNRPFKDLVNTVKGLFDQYMANLAYRWENTLAIGVTPPNNYNLGGESLFASFLYRLKKDYGEQAFVNKLWEEVGKRPAANTTQDAVDNFILASCAAANKNLTGLFIDWKWPVSQQAINEANQLYGDKNKNKLKVTLKGSIAGGVYAHFAVYVNDKKVGEQFSSASYQSYEFSLDIDPEKVEKVQIVFDNDAVINGQDRNLYVQSITIDGKVTNATTQNVVYKNKSGTVIPYHGIMAWSGELIFNYSKKWSFSIVAGITQETANYYGDLNKIKQLISKQFNTINNKFNNPGIFKSQIEFRVDSVYIFSGNAEEEYAKSHPGFDYRLVIDGYPKRGGGWFGIYNAIYHSWSVDSFGGPFGGYGTDALTHEWGHSRGAIDLYALEVLKNNNPVNNQEYEIPFESIMNSPYGINIWDKHSTNIINLTAGGAIPNTDYILKSFPPKIGVKTVDGAGKPIEGVKINFYPVRWYKNTLEAIPTLSIQTGQSGITYLSQNPFMPGSVTEPWNIEYCNFLVEAIYGDVKLYEWLPLFEVQNLFFDDNSKPFLKTFLFNKPSNNITVRAKGSEANSQTAHFKVLLDNVEVGDSYTTTSFENYSFPISKQPTDVRIIFDNDAVINGQDRNLYVQSITIDGKVTNATTQNVVYKNKSGTLIPYHGIMAWNGELIFNSSALFASSRIAGHLGENLEITKTYIGNIKIYPNPGSGLFNLEFDYPVNEPISLNIMDYTGKVIFQNEISLKNEQNLSVDLLQVPPGIYLLRLSYKEQVFAKRLIKN